MAGNSQMNENERGVFSFIHGVTGMLIATVLLLVVLGILTYFSVVVQQNEAQNFYKINTDLDALQFNSVDNGKHYELVGKPQQ